MTRNKKGRGIFGLDIGASANKSWVQLIYPGKVGFEEPVFLSSAIKSTTASYYERITFENNKYGAHLGYDDQYFIVGSYADESARSTRVSQQKCHYAIAKILAVVGWYVKNSEMPLDVEIDLMLPSGEAGMFLAIKEMLFRILHEFKYGPEVLSCNPTRIDIHPEGAGIASYASVFPCSVLMFGHKDITLINLKNADAEVLANVETWKGWGTVKLLRSYPYGFSNELTGTELIYGQSIAKQEKKGALYQFLARMHSPDECEAQMGALEEAKDLIWKEFESELKSDADFMNSKKIYIGGGGAPIWASRIGGLGMKRVDIFKSVRREIEQSFPSVDTAQAMRLIEPYLIWRKHTEPIVSLQDPPQRIELCEAS